jgi:metal-responsive CopG/Arc/MetJ family transcriptional regulator
MEYLSITFPEDLKEALDREAKKEHLKRSTFIQKAVRVYLQLKKHKAEQNLLREGYEATYEVSKKIADEFAGLDKDSLKYVD